LSLYFFREREKMASDSYMAMEVQVDLKDAISKLSSLADKIKDLSETTEK